MVEEEEEESFDNSHIGYDYADQEDLFKELSLRRYSQMRITPSIRLFGYGLICSSIAFGVIFLYAILVAKLMPDTGYKILDWVKSDRYFCYLIPLAILPTYAIIYLNWLSITHFVRN